MYNYKFTGMGDAAILMNHELMNVSMINYYFFFSSVFFFFFT
jgi:hypothetical protein